VVCSTSQVSFTHGIQDITTFTVYMIRYGNGAGNTIDENSSIFSLIQMR